MRGKGLTREGIKCCEMGWGDKTFNQIVKYNLRFEVNKWVWFQCSLQSISTRKCRYFVQPNPYFQIPARVDAHFSLI